MCVEPTGTGTTSSVARSRILLPAATTCVKEQGQLDFSLAQWYFCMPRFASKRRMPEDSHHPTGNASLTKVSGFESAGRFDRACLSKETMLSFRSLHLDVCRKQNMALLNESASY